MLVVFTPMFEGFFNDVALYFHILNYRPSGQLVGLTNKFSNSMLHIILTFLEEAYLFPLMRCQSKIEQCFSKIITSC